YDGTAILVSHDRDFLDRVATTTVAMEGDGRATVYAGGWSDYQSQKSDHSIPPRPQAKPAKSKGDAAEKPKPKPAGLSFTEKHRLDALPAEIERLEAEIAKLEDFLAQPDLYSQSPVKFQKGTEALTERQTALTAAEEEWLMLEEKAQT
ncbi:MAG: ABC transporter ATP-binding protein, partial [Pseudomonadota bacterium]